MRTSRRDRRTRQNSVRNTERCSPYGITDITIVETACQRIVSTEIKWTRESP